MENSEKLIKKAANILINNLDVKKEENLLIVTDEKKSELGEIFFRAGGLIGAETITIQYVSRGKSGIEPPALVSNAMKEADVAVCITENSISHTQARKEAAENMTRVATMPNLDIELLSGNAFNADYDALVERGETLSDILNNGSEVTIKTDVYSLDFKIDTRKSKTSTGFLRDPGAAGNLPSGEVFIAPLEGTGNGEIIIDGSIAGIGLLNEPMLLKIKDGLLKSASGKDGEKLLEILGKDDGRNLAEFGIGINEMAIVSGNTLEDEKVLGTCHVAFGTNNTFGGVIDAGVHIDAVTQDPRIIIDGKEILGLIR